MAYVRAEKEENSGKKRVVELGMVDASLQFGRISSLGLGAKGLDPMFDEYMEMGAHGEFTYGGRGV